MSQPKSFTGPIRSLPRVRKRPLVRALSTLALLVMVGSAWVLEWNWRDTTQSITRAQHVDETDADASDDHHADTNADAEPHADTDADDELHGHTSADDEPHADTDADDELHGHASADDELHADEQDAHGGDHGHSTKAPPVSPFVKQVVLSAFAGVNGLVLLAAIVQRRRNPPKLPKHLRL